MSSATHPRRRLPIATLFAVALLFVLTACQPGSNIGDVLAGRSSASDSGSANATKTPTEADAQQSSAPVVDALTPTATSTPIKTATPGAPPTATPTALATANADAAQQLVTDGQALYLASDLTGAESKFIEAIANDPSSVEAHIKLANLYLTWPQYWQQAIRVAEAAVKLAPEDATALAYLAWAYQGAHDFAGARQNAEKAVELGPDSAVAHNALADVLSSMYELDKAYDEAQTAVKLDENSTSAWSSLGAIAFSLENWDEATAAYDQAKALEPDFFGWDMLQARHELNLTGDVERARELLEPALKTQPDHPWVLSFLVDAAVEENDWQGAEELCVKLEQFNTPSTPYPDAYECSAGILLLEERLVDAERYQTLAEQVAPKARRDISLLRMRLFTDNDKCADARKLAQEWYDERPYSVLALRMIGVSYLCDEDFDKAIDYFKQTVEKLPRSVADARLLANAYARNEKPTEARTALSKVAKFASQNPLYYQGLYEVQLFTNKSADAIKTAQRWQVLRPTSTDAMISLALAQLFDDKVDAAKASAQAALEAGSIDSSMYAILGQSYIRTGDLEQGEEFLLEALARNKEHFLAHNFISTLYLFTGRCEQAKPHVAWLKLKSTNEENMAQLDEMMKQCEKQAAPLPKPDAASGLEDEAVVKKIETLVDKAGSAKYCRK